MKKYSFIIACLFTTSVLANNSALYDSEIETLEIPEVIIVGQEGEYYVELQKRDEEGFVFEVTLVEQDAEGVEDPDESRATYDLATGMVEIPLVAVFSPNKNENEPLQTFSVKMLKKGEEGLIFAVTEAIPLKKVSIKTTKHHVKQSVECGQAKTFFGWRYIERDFFQGGCPQGWFPL